MHFDQSARVFSCPSALLCVVSVWLVSLLHVYKQWRIQDFPQGGGAPTPKIAIIFHIFAENCMKMKEFGPPGGARVPGAPLGSANDKGSQG